MHYCRCTRTLLYQWTYRTWLLCIIVDVQVHYFTNELTELDYYALLQMYKYITLPMNLQNVIIMHYCRCTSTLLYQWTYITWLLCFIVDVQVHYFTNELTELDYYASLQMYTYITSPMNLQNLIIMHYCRCTSTLLYQWTYSTWLVCIIADVHVHYLTNELTELDYYALL